MLKVIIKKSTLEGNKITCELETDENCFDIYYHKNIYPNYRFIELGVCLPINIPYKDVTEEIKTKYLTAIMKLFESLKYVDDNNITDIYLKGMLIQYLQQYGLTYDANRIF